jgi:hypothetical protein
VRRRLPRARPERRHDPLRRGQLTPVSNPFNRPWFRARLDTVLVLGSVVLAVGLQTRWNAPPPPVHADTIAAAVDEHSSWASNSNQLAHPSRGDLLKLPVPSVW